MNGKEQERMEFKSPLFAGLAQGCTKGRKSSIFCELKLSIINPNNTWLHRKSYYYSNATLLYSVFFYLFVPRLLILMLIRVVQ